MLSANLQNSLSAMMIEQYSYFHLDANPKFLYEDLDVQEIVWTEEDDLKDQSHGNLKREERKVCVFQLGPLSSFALAATF